MSGKRVEEKKGTQMALPEILLKGSLVSALVMLGVLLAGAGAISAGVLGQEMMERWGMLACVAGSLSGGVVSARTERRWALALGVGTGGILFGVLLLVGSALYGVPSAITDLIPALLSCLCGGGAAGILGRKNKKKRKR